VSTLASGPRPGVLASPPGAWWDERLVAAREARRYARVFLRSASSVTGLALVAAFLVLAAVGPYIVPYPEDARGAVHLDAKLTAPGPAHWFGTDEVGGDVYTRVVMGARLSLEIGLIITGLAALIGVPLGVLAGYSRGAAGEVIMRVTDVFLSVPALVLAIAIVGALGPGIVNAMVAIALVWWPGYVRLVQGKTLALRQEVFVEAARAMGSGGARIAFLHVLPNCVSTIVVKMSMDMGTAILTAASLGFVGLGAQPPFPEWGAMISHGRNYLPTWWWYSAFPGLFIYLTVLGFNLLGDGLRDVLDPKSRSG
jgi:peptide/nickel transport system permease protein